MGQPSSTPGTGLWCVLLTTRTLLDRSELVEEVPVGVLPPGGVVGAEEVVVG